MIAVVSVVSLVSACAPRPAATEPTGIPLGETRPPRDLALAVTVLGSAADDPLAPQPARFVIEPDGLLRAATGSGVGPGVYPPRTRRLIDAQIAEIYTMLVRSGLDRGVGGMAYRPGLLPGEGRWILVEVTAHERREIALYDPARSEAARDIALHLARLARLDAPDNAAR